MDDIWSEYPTIATHPRHVSVRLVKHPNGPAVVDSACLMTVGSAVRATAEQKGPAEAGELAEWIAFALAGVSRA